MLKIGIVGARGLSVANAIKARDDAMITAMCDLDEDELKGDMVYTMFSLIIDYLNNNYRSFMKCIWQGE